MRILHLVHQYPPEHIGGTEFYTQWLAQAQQAQGHDVAVFHRRSGAGTGVAHHAVDGVAVWSVWQGAMDGNGRFRATFGDDFLAQALAGVLDDFQPELVHVQHLMGLPASVTQQLQQRHIPYVVTLHDYFYFCANAQLITNYDETLCAGPAWYVNCARCALARAERPGALWAVPGLVPLLGWRNRLLRQALAGAAAIIAPSHFVAEAYGRSGLPTAQMTIIPHGITPPDAATQRLIAARRPSPVPPLRLVYVGGIAPQKGLHVLLEAARRFAIDDCRVTIYGDTAVFPDYVAQLEGLAGENVTFAERLPREQLWTALLDADALVVPALWHETSSLVIDEAFAARLPVLASALGAMTEKVDHGVNGLLFPAGDAEALAAHLKGLVAQPQRLAQMAAHVPPLRTIAEHLVEVTAVYQQVLGKNRYADDADFY